MATDNFEGLGDETLRNAQGIRNSIDDIQDSTTRMSRALGESTKRYSEQFKLIRDSANKVADIQNNALKTSKATGKAIEEQAKQLNLVRSLNAQIDDLYIRSTRETGATADLLKRQAINLAEARDNAKALASTYGNIARDASKLDGKTRFFSKLAEIAKSVPVLNKLASPFEKAAIAARTIAIEQAKVANIVGREDRNGKMRYYDTSTGKSKRISDEQGEAAMAIKRQSPTAAAMKAGGGDLMSGMLGNAGWIGLLVEAVKMIWEIFTGAQKQSVEIARNMGVTRESANDIRDSYQDIALKSGETYVNTTNLIKAQLELTSQLQSAAGASEKTLLAQTFLTERMKMSGDAAAVLSARSEAIGENAEYTVDQMMHQNALDVKRQKSFLTQGQLLKAVSKTTGEIAAYFGYSNKAIAEGIKKVNQFGLGLQEAKNISEALLNFESSIANELELELLSGKEFNMEKARVLALTGHQAEATEEVMKQMQKMTAEQRRQPMLLEATSKLLNLSKDQIADAYLLETDRTRQKQEYTKLLREGNGLEATQFASKHGFNQQEMKDAQGIITLEEQYKEAIAKVKDQFMGLVSSGAIDKLTDLIKVFANVITKEGIGGFVSLTGKNSFQKGLEAQQQAAISSAATGARLSVGPKGLNVKQEEVLASLQEKTQEKSGMSTFLRAATSFSSMGTVEAEDQRIQQESLQTLKDLRDKKSKMDESGRIMPVQDFTIRPLGKDTISMAGGTKLGGNVEALLEELISAVRGDKKIYIGANALTEGIGIHTNQLGSK